ncbi:hypothetical protein [Paenibacillus sp. DMB5]|uniref:hypothetical protein n=1 Tax=Paenibacillus sp. DMB5 TaxID=1780103 RepID=UPI000FE13F55|nr:hypothetical protein [Paenibacillus sp. DMB5]
MTVTRAATPSQIKGIFDLDFDPGRNIWPKSRAFLPFDLPPAAALADQGIFVLDLIPAATFG